MQNNFNVRYWAVRKIKILALSLIFTLIGVGPVSAFDFSDWDALIKRHVSPKKVDGILIHAINYEDLRKDTEFTDLVSRLRSAQLDSLMSRDEKLAFWINTYNILAAKMVADHFPIKSIKDVGSFFSPVWKKTAGNVAGKERTLDEIEHKILRKMDEPRIHVAIVCASVSCPDLRLEAYQVESLDEQLNDQLIEFLKSSEKGMKIDKKGRRVYLSSIFKWFEDDFESRGGVLKFISNYVLPKVAKELSRSDIKVSSLDYTGNVNS
ncbi:MAG: DUF547 domain-containing protein [Nitrospinae bacterium]|nr:DUF547 domain-containing protein [Nitrospinota bacterium]